MNHKAVPEQHQQLMNLLSQGLNAMKIHLSQEIQLKLISLIELLFQWNKVHNLTAVRDPNEMIQRHLLDSLSILAFLNSGTRACDVGTGAGFPGLPLALCLPEMKFWLLDSNQKKINFVQQAKITLNLNNVEVVCSRAQNFKPGFSFDWVISRALGSLSEFVQATEHLLATENFLDNRAGDNQGRWLAMKGKIQKEELAALPKGFTMEHIYSLAVPTLEGDRSLVVIKRK